MSATRAVRSALAAGCLVFVLAACVQQTTGTDATGMPTPSMAAPIPDDTSTIIPEPTVSEATAEITVAGTDASGTIVSASGYVAGVAEEGGVCRFVFTNGTDSIESTRTGIINVSTTSCGLVDLDIAQFAGSAWTVTLNYESPSVGSVVSEPQPVELP